MFQPFQIEQFMSENEQGVDFIFSESGVHPITFGEFVALAGLDQDELGAIPLNYPEVNGFRSLREKIANLYEGAGPDNVLVTVGASEANNLIVQTLLEPDDQVIAFRPTYQQLTGVAENYGARVDTVGLVEENGWALDLDELEQKVADQTKIIHVVNPHNPTGHILGEDERSAIIAAAERSGAWLVADEVYAGTELQKNDPTPSFWGTTERVIAINSMSKAYGMPGLRLGWVVAPTDLITRLWRRHEYATISATMLGNVLADAALEPAIRAKLLDRARHLIRRGFDTLQEGLSVHPGVFSVVPPEASAMAFVSYDLPIDSMTLARRLVAEKSTLIVPGDCFGMANHFRFSSALPEDYLREGLARINALVGELTAQTS